MDTKSTKDAPTEIDVYYDELRRENRTLQNILATMEEQFSKMALYNMYCTGSLTPLSTLQAPH